MKSFLRILAVALIATMLCSSVAFAAPKSLSAIEGLPEIPANPPEMKTKNNGVVQTVTLSEPLASLKVYDNGEWLDVTFDETGLVGTIDMNPNLNFGYNKASSAWTWSNWGRGTWVPLIEGETDEELAKRIDEAKEALLEEAPLDTKEAYRGYEWTYYDWDEETGEEYEVTVKNPHDFHFIGPEYLTVQPYYDWEYVEEIDDWIQTDELLGYDVIVMRDENETYFYTRPNAGYTLTYEGETTDGIKVHYDNYGKAVEMIQTLEGVNFLGSEEAPVKTEVYFEWQEFEKNGAPTGKWVIRSIKEYYADETSLHVQYLYSGDYEKTFD